MQMGPSIKTYNTYTYMHEHVCGTVGMNLLWYESDVKANKKNTSENHRIKSGVKEFKLSWVS